MKKNAYSSDYEEIVKMGKILAGIVVVLGLLYLLFGIVSGEIKLRKEEKVVEIQYQEILAGSIPHLTNSEYYVLLYDFNNDSINRYIQFSSAQYGSFFKVDLNKGFNESYIAKDAKEKNVKDLNNLKVLNPTLIKVADKKIESVFETEEAIMKELLK